MASARQKNGKWYYRITITEPDGNHKYIERGSFKTKKEALIAGNDKEKEIKSGEIDIRQKFMSFYFLSTEWLENYKLIYKLSTIEEHRSNLNNRILPILKDFDIRAIKRSDCQIVINKMVKDKLGRGSIINVKGTMSRCFKYAIESGYLKENPCDNLIIPAPRTKAAKSLKKSKPKYAVSKEEIKLIFERFPEGTRSFLPLFLAYRLGLRRSEIFGLTIDDIDFETNHVYIFKQLSYDSKRKQYYFTEPKYCNPGEGRIVKADNKTMEVLKRHIQRIELIEDPIMYYEEDGYIFTGIGKKQVKFLNIHFTTGKMLSPKFITWPLKVIHDEIDPNFTLHLLRHTHASECIAAGMNPVSVQKRLGHKNLTTTYKTYVHETETQVTESSDIIEKMFHE